MLKPDSSLFYDLILEVLGDNSVFATKAIETIKLVSGDHPYVQTLAIGKDGVIIVNKDFWRKNIKSRTDAKIVLVHELLHAILGDTNKLAGMADKEEADFRNFSQDMRINAAICENFLSHHEKLEKNVLERLYKTTGPFRLLRPNSPIKKNDKFRLMYGTLYPDSLGTGWNVKQLQNKAKEVFKSEEAIAHALKILLPKNLSKEMEKIVLLGSHTQIDENDFKEVEGVTAKDLEEIDDATKDIIIGGLVDKMPEVSEHSRSYGLHGILTKHMIGVVKNSRSMKIQLLKNFSCSKKVNSIRTMYSVPTRTTSVIPLRPSGKDMAWLAAGYVPTLWKNSVNKTKEENNNIAIYLDVSGSVGSHLPNILGVITSLKRNIQRIYCFSTIVSEHTVQELAKGEYKSSGGTSFGCIVTHAIENKIDKMVVFTDGYASMNRYTKKTVKDNIKDAAIVYFGNHTKDNFWHQTYDKSFELEELCNV
jgi:hypothetical protein